MWGRLQRGQAPSGEPCRATEHGSTPAGRTKNKLRIADCGLRIADSHSNVRKLQHEVENAPVAQLDRALASEAKGRAFESRRAHHITKAFILFLHHRGKISIIRSLSQSIPFVNGPLAQLVEQLTLNQRVEGSTPSRLTIITPRAVSSKQPVGKRCLQRTALFVRAGSAQTSGAFSIAVSS